MRLVRAISAGNNFDEYTNIFEIATADKVSVSPRLVHIASTQVTQASKENPSAWPAFNALLSYNSFLKAKKDKTYSQYQTSTANPPDLKGPVPNIMYQSAQNLYVGYTLRLDGVSWDRDVFKDATIVYDGGPVALKNVKFLNCRFVMGTSQASQDLAKRILSSDTVSFEHLTY